jgi:hypothetical protein
MEIQEKQAKHDQIVKELNVEMHKIKKNSTKGNFRNLFEPGCIETKLNIYLI